MKGHRGLYGTETREHERERENYVVFGRRM